MKEKMIHMIKDLVIGHEENWFAEIDGPFYEEPLVNFASTENTLFTDYKTILGPDHLTPKEAFEMVFGEGSFLKGTVISVVLPLNEKTRKSNRSAREWPSREWVLHRTFADEILLQKIAHGLEDMLSQMGYRTVTPCTADWIKNFKTPTGPRSIWSERHAAYATGLGSFGLNDGFITEKGMAVRFISAITELVVEPDEIVVQNHRASCLFYHQNKCGACIKKCPAEAITEDGHDKWKCLKYTYSKESGELAVSYGGLAKAGSGCGLCQSGVPCEFRDPVAHLDSPIVI